MPRALHRRTNARRGQCGAALLLAMLILVLVTTAAAGMVWRQHRAIEVEAAERARSQALWILDGALDLARQYLRQDARTSSADHLGEDWAVKLAEARLSSFLAADRDNNADSVLEAFLSGQVFDVQSRYNLRALVTNEFKPDPKQVAAFGRLCAALGLPADTAARIADGLAAAWAPNPPPSAPLAPTRSSQLGWLGIDAAAVDRLAPFVVILPVPTPVNANTAPAEVLLAAIDKLDAGSAAAIVQRRQGAPMLTLDELRKRLPAGVESEDSRVGITSRFFEVYAQLRLEERIVGERTIVERRSGGAGQDIVVVQRERWSGAATPVDAKP